jgi:hypothetical protein
MIVIGFANAYPAIVHHDTLYDDTVTFLQFFYFLSPSASGRIWTLNHRIMSWLLYHCATLAQPTLA